MLVSLLFMAIAFAAFGLMTRLWPCNPGQVRLIWKELPDELLYYLIVLVFYSGLTGVATALVVRTVLGGGAPHALASIAAGYGWLARLPLLAQAAIMLLVMDVIQYWLHRAFHGRGLWPFHAIHHSAEEVNWTTTFRVHPVNFVLYNTCTAVLIQLMGFSPLVFTLTAPLNFFTAAMVHANLNWTFGPLKYVFASPVFHRWHHSRDPEVRDRNFAPTFAFLDLMFGTFHMPKDRLPESYGVDGVPQHFVGQMLYPLHVLAAALGRAKPPTGLAPTKP